MTLYADTSLYVDLEAVKDNYLLLQKQLQNSECAAVVKANAYGIGATQVAQTLIKSGCRKFFVATLDEALDLRKHISNHYNIFVLHGLFPGHEQEFLHHNLIPVLNDLYQIKLWNNFAKLQNKKLPAIIHIDTGMNRLGLTMQGALYLLRNQLLLSSLNILYIMSHLAAADNPSHFLNHKQLQKIQLVRNYLPNIPITFANSAGIFLGTSFHFDLARPGMALFGLNPTTNTNPMHNVVFLTSKIIQMRNNHIKTHVGYGGSYYIERNSVIAIIAMGYADGYFRSLGNNSVCYIEGYQASVVGRISMDLIALDVTKIPSHLVYPGQSVEIIGNNITIDQLAKFANTLGYEILTNLGNRIKRIYNYSLEPISG